MVWTRKRRIAAWIGGSVLLFLVAAGVISYVIAKRTEPFLRDQTISYLKTKFNADVRLDALKVRIPISSPLQLLMPGGKRIEAHVTGTGIELKDKNFSGPSLVKMRRFTFRIALASLALRPIIVPEVNVEEFELNVPPKGERPHTASEKPNPEEEKHEPSPEKPSVVVERVIADGMKLAMLPKDPAKAPLRFHMKTLRLEDAGPGIPMRYETVMTNPKPPGLIRARGSFGPWVSDSPSESKVSGTYTFDNADLSVFKGISGILASTGKFEGTIDNITVDGETRIPDFKLKRGGNAVPLTTTFHAIVDGRNGNTFLQPVEATLAGTRFAVEGYIARFEGERGKTIDLKAVFKEGRIEDALRLAVPGDRPILRGPMSMKVDITLPPGKGDVEDRLLLNGTFALTRAMFQSEAIQKRVDELSRRGQGEPESNEIRSVPCTLSGRFRMSGGKIHLSNMLFKVKGADVDLAGDYDFGTGAMDFEGRLSMTATVSQTMGGWKRWALKPADPFFKKGGYGSVIPIKITGTRNEPKFGANFGK